MISVPLHQKLLSYLQPVLLDRSVSDVSGYLELRLYHNRFQLLTAGALYSDGERYFPAVAVARHLRGFLPAVERVLVLGAGLGSVVQVMRGRGLNPHYTLVDKDKVVLRWTRQILGQAGGESPGVNADQGNGNEEAVLDDAEAFMARNQRKFDLVFVDVFAGRGVPDFVTTPVFLGRCRDSLTDGGHLALNYLEASQERWNQLRKTFGDIFPDCHVICKDDNRILISQPARTP